MIWSAPAERSDDALWIGFQDLRICHTAMVKVEEAIHKGSKAPSPLRFAAALQRGA